MKTINITTTVVNNKPVSITDKVKSFEDACFALGITGDVFKGSVHDQLGSVAGCIEAHTKLLIIAMALNEGWIPDWSNDEEPKYYPWWDMENGFQLYCVNYLCNGSSVCSRLCFKTEELAKYAASQFFDLYKQYFLIQ